MSFYKHSESENGIVLLKLKPVDDIREQNPGQGQRTDLHECKFEGSAPWLAQHLSTYDPS